MFASLAASPGFVTNEAAAMVNSSATAASGITSSTPPAPNPGIGAQTGFDAKVSQTMSGSNSLREAMNAVGPCGIFTRSPYYATGSPGSSIAHFTAGVSAPVKTVCPDIEPVIDRRTLTPAISSMWAWGNPVSAKVDARGLGQAAMGPAALAAFASSRQFTDGHLSVPFASNQGAAISQ